MTQLGKAEMGIHSLGSIGSYPLGSGELSGQRVGGMLQGEYPHRLSNLDIMIRLCGIFHTISYHT